MSAEVCWRSLNENIRAHLGFEGVAVWMDIHEMLWEEIGIKSEQLST